VIKPDYFFQDIVQGIVSYKQNPKKPLVELSGKECLVCFHGKPKLKEASRKANWVNDYINEVL
jgi:hypothetical protein